eukprot:CAMPEP_0115271258 /NCGR_PEP_ID=MMETSP0270-20121206/54001_1 /TAXON_ID=71861 /ORGANISM="Scrippsiella trochoidea, Strain CCMP3099" /LENGTH=598 /DNA_ID=CAMNT_0002687601 /DNA_START=108 /DNA_END=1905 /DNA_ORIENTATION=+
MGGVKEYRKAMGKQMQSRDLDSTLESTAELSTRLRVKAKHMVESPTFEQIMGKVVVANMILMCIETNAQAGCETADCSEVWHKVASSLFQAVYTAEVCLYIFVYRTHFCENRWRILDAFVVVTGFLDIILAAALSSEDELPGPSLSILRIFRLARLLRVARIMRFFPELYCMISGFLGAMMAMFWGMFMISVLLLIWSIVAVETLGPVNKNLDWGDNEYCKDSLTSIQNSLLMFFQTVFAGDSWGACSVPIIKEAPWSIIVFAGTLITIQLGFTNLVLAVIVERATKAQQDDSEQVLKERRKWHEKALDQLERLIGAIDKDKSGSISFQELVEGYEEQEELATLLGLMDIEKKDLEVIFQYLADESGEAVYNEFVESLYRCECDDPRRQMMMMSLQIGAIQRHLNKTVKNRNSLASNCTVKMQRPSPSRQSLTCKTTISKMVLPRTLVEHEDLGFNESVEVLRDSLDAKLDELSKGFKEQAATLARHTELLSAMADSRMAVTSKGTSSTAWPVAASKSKKAREAKSASSAIGRKEDGAPKVGGGPSQGAQVYTLGEEDNTGSTGVVSTQTTEGGAEKRPKLKKQATKTVLGRQAIDNS